MSIIKPVESAIHTFYKIPGYSRYAISRDGVVINLDTENELSGSVNVHGYRLFHLIDDDGAKHQIGRHRLLCLVFKNSGCDYSSMHVNHKNNTPGDDWLDNLEWATPKENAVHAAVQGRSPKKVKVQTRHAITGEVNTYESFIECGRANKLSRDMVIYRVKNGPARMFNDKLQYRYYSEQPWPTVDVQTELIKNDVAKPVTCLHLISGTEMVFDKVSDMAEFIGIAPSTATTWLNALQMRVQYGGWLVKYLEDGSAWRSDLDTTFAMFDNYNEHSKRKVVQVVDDITGLISYYWNAADAARAHNLKPTALDYRLKSKGLSVFSDGCRYGYYPY